ncbi:NUDIX hydrolase [Microbacterium sp. HD4P20]|uniref:NUDIX domain-containing protein n=1 Tax=Microbacterium sp. HD4P20 TaxID=2864874 RepID=UPI001C63D976|nr:NUDIX hydrolase [Microbacterium sp. HD4P20]MCP2637216.1 NUDIX hydrolase [Microbacterium sp. HD4P20]
MPETPTGAALADEPLDPTVIASELVYQGRVWDVRSDTVTYGDGTIVRQYVDHPGAAAVVVLDEDDRMLLIQQYRHPIRHRDWEIPAGLLDVDGESPLETAQRELAEEVDLEAATWEPLVRIFTTPGGNDEIVHLFLARDLSPAGAVHAREDEEADIALAWVALDDVVAGILAGRLRNGIMTVGALAAAERVRVAQAEAAGT